MGYFTQTSLLLSCSHAGGLSSQLMMVLVAVSVTKLTLTMCQAQL